MTSIEETEHLNQRDRHHHRKEILGLLEEEMRRALEQYLEIVDTLLEGSGIRREEVPPSFFGLKHNFFSILFLFSYVRAGIAKERRIFYAAVNQCLRGMVTGCDNLLDDEYKQTLPTDLPETAVRFRSVLDIMASDRVLFELLLQAISAGKLTLDQARRISGISLGALLKSGAQEAGEESGVSRILSPEQILSTVHHYKTGLLFQAPWAIPEKLEKISPAKIEDIKTDLYKIGMGCQLMDDMVDLQRDIHSRRHNYLFSLIYFAQDPLSCEPEEAFRAFGEKFESSEALLNKYPQIRSAALQTALGFLRSGLSSLFSDNYLNFVEPAIQFLFARIGIPAAWRA